METSKCGATPPRVQAETVLNAAPWQQSLSEGFERLANYISGANSRRLKIAMTAPGDGDRRSHGPRDAHRGFQDPRQRTVRDAAHAQGSSDHVAQDPRSSRGIARLQWSLWRRSPRQETPGTTDVRARSGSAPDRGTSPLPATMRPGRCPGCGTTRCRSYCPRCLACRTPRPKR